MDGTFGRYKPTHGRTLNRAHPLARGLLGAYLLNERAGATLRDKTQLGGPLSGIGAFSWVPGVGPNGMAISLPGGSVGFSGRAPALVWNSGTIILSAFKNTFLSTQILFDTETAERFEFFVTANGSIPSYGLTIASDVIDSAGSTGHLQNLIPLGTRAQVAITWTSTAQSVYQNGQLFHSYSGGPTSHSVPITMFLGMGNASSFGWKGSIDYLYAWNRVLSQAEINAMYEMPFQMFSYAEMDFGTAFAAYLSRFRSGSRSRLVSAWGRWS